MSWRESEIIGLASEGIFYPSDHPFSKGFITIYPLTGRCEDLLCNGSLIKRGMVLQTLFDEVLESKVDVSTILQCDVDTILLNLRIIAYGSEATYKITCDGCGSSDEHTVSYSFRAKDFDASRYPRGKNELTYVLPNSGLTVKYRLPTYTENKVLVKDGWLTFIKKQTIAVQDVEDIESFYDYDISIKDNKSFKNHFALHSPGFHSQFEVKCPSCEKVAKSKLEIDTDIFGFSPTQKKALHTEIFNLCYHSNGAFTQESVYAMPVNTRTFYLKNLAETRLKENEKNSDQGSTPTKSQKPNRPVVKKAP